MQQELQEVVDYMVSQEHILRRYPVKLQVYVRPVYRGHAYYRTGRITIPDWALEKGIEYAYSYVIHEVCHFLTIGEHHNKKFKEVETRWLREFGLVPVYRRAYKKQLLTINGEVLFSR